MMVNLMVFEMENSKHLHWDWKIANSMVMANWTDYSTGWKMVMQKES